MTVILFFFIRNFTPFDSCAATLRLRSTIFVTSKRTLSADSPNSCARWIRWKISDDTQQRLRRDAAPVEADPAQVLTLDDGRLQPQLRAADRDT
jgi:hypothetical protein